MIYSSGMLQLQQVSSQNTSGHPPKWRTVQTHASRRIKVRRSRPSGRRAERRQEPMLRMPDWLRVCEPDLYLSE